ncbi:hypothetical protein MSG28_012686 [Choristoneura fumiferana]|uniref:Uncharacterized protein n=1 Tax=Choristoneura fumiferana TaxID=7141 RepID=A0ACC0JHQ8_CHOFU|nr:hypothetical protein MSG28_012686 [Choristoneura fumiferana]
MARNNMAAIALQSNLEKVFMKRKTGKIAGKKKMRVWKCGMAARAVWWIAAALVISTDNALSDSTFLDFPWLRYLHCYNQHKEADQPEAVHYNITDLDLHDSNITALNAFNIKCYPNLLQLNLNGNKIRRIGIDAFNSVVALQNLFLEDNAFLGEKLAPNLFTYPSPLLTTNQLQPTNCTPLSTILGRSHPVLASHLVKIIAEPSLRASHDTLADPRSPLNNSFTPAVIGSSSDMASPHATSVCLSEAGK